MGGHDGEEAGGWGLMESAVRQVLWRSLLWGTGEECGLVLEVHVMGWGWGHISLDFLVGRSELGQGIRHLEGTDPGGHQ